MENSNFFISQDIWTICHHPTFFLQVELEKHSFPRSSPTTWGHFFTPLTWQALKTCWHLSTSFSLDAIIALPELVEDHVVSLLLPQLVDVEPEKGCNQPSTTFFFVQAENTPCHVRENVLHPLPAKVTAVRFLNIYQNLPSIWHSHLRSPFCPPSSYCELFPTTIKAWNIPNQPYAMFSSVISWKLNMREGFL